MSKGTSLEPDFNNLHDKDVKIFPPDYTIKKLIGEDVDIKAIFNDENINKAQEVITSHTENFLEWVQRDISSMEAFYTEATKDVVSSKAAIDKLAHLAFVVKSQAGTFGYQLATSVAKSLDDFCTGHYEPKAEHLVVVRKHLDTLRAIFEKKILGDGGDVGAHLYSSLQTLVQKYVAPKTN